MSYSELKDRIYVDYHKKVFGYLVSRVNDSELASDLCSDIFVKIYEKLETYDESKSSISTWIYTITRNTLTDYYRTRRITDEVPETFSVLQTPETEYLTKETLEGLADALSLLNERERDIIILRYYSGMKLTEISDKLCISYSYVKTLHNKALSAMKKSLAGIA